MVFDSVESAIKALEKAVVDTSLKEISKNVEITLKDSIQDTVYSNPSNYDRTNSFLNSVDSITEYDSNGVEILAMSDPSKMNPSHTSWSTGKDVDEYITMWLNDGHSAGLANFDYPAQHFVEDSQSIIDSKSKSWLKNGLKKRGFDMV